MIKSVQNCICWWWKINWFIDRAVFRTLSRWIMRWIIFRLKMDHFQPVTVFPKTCYLISLTGCWIRLSFIPPPWQFSCHLLRQQTPWVVRNNPCLHIFHLHISELHLPTCHFQWGSKFFRVEFCQSITIIIILITIIIKTWPISVDYPLILNTLVCTIQKPVNWFANHIM